MTIIHILQGIAAFLGGVVLAMLFRYAMVIWDKKSKRDNRW